MSEETEETDNMDGDMYGCDENGKNEYGEDCWTSKELWKV